MPVAETVENPVTRLRATLGMTRAEFARATGVSYQTITRAECGYAPELPASVLRALEGAGVDPEAAVEAYRAWRASLRRPLVPQSGG